MMTFKTLLHREWMQHQTGWLVLAGLPLVIMLLALPFGGVHMDGGESATDVVLVISGGYTLLVTLMAWMAVSFQATSLARRDQQDRSIEFWRSLPVSDWQAVGATALMHLLLVPLVVMLVAAVSAVLVALLVVMRLYGAAALVDLPWLSLVAAAAATVPRMVLGVLLAAFWAAPMLMLLMLASTWLKRWAVPVVLAVVGGGGAILKYAYQQAWVHDTLGDLAERFLWAMIPLGREGHNLDAEHGPASALAQLPSWMLEDSLRVLGDVVTPLGLFAAVFAAACFALQVQRRRQFGA